jgi:ATP-dependent DNA helicase PIF1
LQQVYPDTVGKEGYDFGHLGVILMGDFYQIPPVAEKPLFNTDSVLKGLDHINGQRLYKLFQPTIKLEQVMRQQGKHLKL